MLMGDDVLTEEQRALIEAKRRKALENRNRFQSKSSEVIPRPSETRVEFRESDEKTNLQKIAKPLRTNTPHTSLQSTLSWNNPKTCSVRPSALVSLPIHTTDNTAHGVGGTLPRDEWKPLSRSAGAEQSRPNPSTLMPSSSTNVPSITVTCVLISHKTFEVHARYHAGLSELYKSLPSRQYDAKSRKWSFALSDYNDFVKRAKAIPGIVIDGLPNAVLKIFKNAFTLDSKEKKAPDVKLADFLPDDLIHLLLPFQREGVSKAIARNGRVLLADDMGLGKTVQALALAVAYRSDWPMLIVAPSSVRFAWRDQCLRWLAGPAQLTANDILMVNSGRDLDNVNRYTKTLITLISYDLMAKHAVQIELCKFGMVIMDESHFLKNIKTARTKAALIILKAAKRVVLLSGTPAVSRPAELYPQIQAVAPNLFRGGFHEFGLRYCAAKECPWGWDYTGCSNMAELQLVLEASVMIRRIKADVLSQLPPKRRELIVLDPSAIKVARLKRHAKAMASNSLSSDQRRSAMLEYFHESASVKVVALRQYVLDLIEVGRKFLLYAHHTEILDALSNLLMERSIDYIRIDGRTNSEQRSVVCKKFQQDENCRVALLSITAAGTGLNLTAANLVVFGELFWNPGALVQAEDRAYRIGQQDSVVIRYLIAEGTVDDYIWPLIERKLQVLSSAGLNRETFRTADTTRLGSASSEQKSILEFFEHELLEKETSLTEADPDDNLLLEEMAKTTSMPSPLFELDWDSKTLVEPTTKRTKVTNLFDPDSAPRLSTTITLTGTVAPERVLVANTPDASPEKDVSAPKPLDSTHTANVDNMENTVVNLEEDDTVLLEAAEAAEVAWLTEGLLNEADSEKFG